jgi:fructoselysine 6-kinase
MDVVCVGDCGVDLYLPSGLQCFGGITANFARHARREFPEDDRIHIVSCVGDDADSDLVLSSLAESGIECHIDSLHGRTPVQTIEIQPDGEKDFVHYDEGVLRDFHFDNVARRLISGSDLLVAPVYLQIVGLFDELMAIPTQGLVSVDFADFQVDPDFHLLERHLENIDIAFFGLSADDTATTDRLRVLADRQQKLIVVTLGPGGSRSFAGSRHYDCPAEPVDAIVDTTGAGDAYAAGFLSRFCHGASIEACMQHGAKVAASVIGQIGSYPAD